MRNVDDLSFVWVKSDGFSQMLRMNSKMPLLKNDV
jgi:hypothetical protein